MQQQIEKIKVNKKIIKIKKDKDVYSPAEDTFLLLRNLKKLQGDILEIGTGSGIVSIYLAKENKKKKIYASDISKKAIENAKINAQLNLVKIKFILSDLFKKIPKKKFDFIIFNPPYLPTEKNEKINGPINYAFDGGKKGDRVIKIFLKKAKDFLKDEGAIFLVVSSLIDLNKLEYFIKKLGYTYKKIDQEDFFFEHIFLYKIMKNKK
jgi:release factor glutamine methyltransferase